MIVYLITNLANGKIYVGKTVLSLEMRWRQHVRDAMNDAPYYISRAIRKHKPENFIQSTLRVCDSIEEMDALEIKLIAAFKATNHQIGYNCTDGGDGCLGRAGEKHPLYGKHHSDATREKMRKSHIGKPHPHNKDQHGKKNAMFGRKGKDNPLYGRKCPESTKAAVSITNKGKTSVFKGKKHSEESKAKMSTAAKARSQDVKDNQAERLRLYMATHVNPMLGKHPSEEANRKNSERQKGKVISDDVRRRTSETMKRVRAENKWSTRKRSKDEVPKCKECFEDGKVSASP